MMSQKTYRTILWGTSVFGVLCFIFANSLLPSGESAEESRSFLDLLRAFFPFLTHHLVRKIAHVAEYALLGAHLAFAPSLWCVRARFSSTVSILFGTLVALIDEGIQRFVPGRGASLGDVLIDTLGYLFGLVLIFVLLLLIQRRKKNA